MLTDTFQSQMERSQRRWVMSAFVVALLLHLMVALYFDWIRIPALATPSHLTVVSGPFQLKRIEVRPEALRPPAPEPLAQTPQNEPQGINRFNLDPRQLDRVLQLPQPTLAHPALPDPTHIAATTPLDNGVPFVESEKAAITQEISHFRPGLIDSPTVTTGQLADNLVSSQAGPLHNGVPAGTTGSGSGASEGAAPGFAQMLPNFKLPPPELRNLPDPVLVRLPADVLFDFDSSTLKPEAEPLLTQASSLITKYSQANVQVDGYSDSIGKPDYNLTLSEKRAQAVLDWLKLHVPATAFNFQARGHGSTNFVVDPKGTIEQQQQNRRVELLIQALKF